jgi:diacylglycerol kinase (ATP)
VDAAGDLNNSLRRVGVMRCLLIANPISGRGAGARAVDPVSEQLRSAGITFEVARTERPWHAAEMAARAASDGWEAVVAIGGDGTANEVLNGLMQIPKPKRPVMGIIAVGRGNDFAYGMGVPPGVAEGCRAVLSGLRRRIDVGRVTGGLYPQGRYFGNGIGIGFDAVVGFEALKLAPLSGFASYIVAALKTISLYDHGPRLRIELDGQARVQETLMVSVMNGRRMGGGFHMAPKGDPGDGQFDVCIAGQVTRGRILSLIPHFLKGDQEGQPAISVARCRQVRVVAEEGVLPAHADGETLCVDGHELQAELLPAQIEVLSAVGN